MKKTAEEMLDELDILVNKIVDKLEKKNYVPPINEKKNSHLHIMIETSLMLKVEKQAKEKGVSVAEFVRQKLNGNDQLDRIEEKVDKIFNRK